jgi:1-phosphofructokinase family hexose kinase
MIFITPNPAIDRTLLVPNFTAGEVHRSASTIVVAGGKGLNAARAARRLGAEPVCMGFTGGQTGQHFEKLAQNEGLRVVWTPITGETRICIILVDESTGSPSVVNEPGPAVSVAEWGSLQKDIFSTLKAQPMQQGTQVCFSGSLPPGTPPGLFGETICSLSAAGYAVWVDTSGLALKTALASAPAGIKVNADEAAEVLGQPIHSVADAAAAARKIYQRRIQSVVLTLGKDGAVMVTKAGAWHATPSPIRAVSNVGSGDSFFGALVVALERGLPPVTALAWGVAAGAANAMSAGGASFAFETFQELLQRVAVEEV